MERIDITAVPSAPVEADGRGHAEHLFWLSPDLLAVAGFDGLLKLHNAAWTPALGYGDDQLRTTPYLEFVHPDDRAETEAVIARLAGGERIAEYECRILHRDGGVRLFAWSGSPGSDVFYIVGRDVTERRALEHDAREFAHVASHDLSEPLRAVSGYLGLLEGEVAQALDARALAWLEAAKTGADRMRQLIDDLLRFSQVANMEAAWEPVDLAVVARDVLQWLEPALDERGARVEVGTLPQVVGQPTQLGQLLQNLVVNAVKFGGRCVRLDAARNDEGWVVTVGDDGAGIRPADRDRIFGMFARAHGEDGPAGSGIGLALCRRVVERHGGRIWVESEVGVGSAFHVLLPDQPHET